VLGVRLGVKRRRRAVGYCCVVSGASVRVHLGRGLLLLLLLLRRRVCVRSGVVRCVLPLPWGGCMTPMAVRGLLLLLLSVLWAWSRRRGVGCSGRGVGVFVWRGVGVRGDRVGVLRGDGGVVDRGGEFLGPAAVGALGPRRGDLRGLVGGVLVRRRR
jgi:hypothetical protein